MVPGRIWGLPLGRHRTRKVDNLQNIPRVLKNRPHRFARCPINHGPERGMAHDQSAQGLIEGARVQSPL